MTASLSEAVSRYLAAFVEELVASGVTDVCLCPGSRSTPLALSFARHPAVKVWTHLDERSCSYFALGMAKARGMPVALLCSSGTAAVNFAPAVVEAFHGRVPLLVLTADRPQELREIGANQTIDQGKLYGTAAKWSLEMLLPEASAAALRYVRMAAARAVSTALADARGPVHLNFPFREPLVPAPQSFEATEAAGLAMARAPRPPAEMCEDWLATEFIERRRGLIVCGPQDDPAFPAAVAGLAATLGYPLLADALSGVRCGPHRDGIVLGAYDNFLRSAALGESLLPDLVLRFGAAPVSKQLATYLQRQEQALHVLVSPDGAWRDPELTATAVVEADATAFCRAFQWQTESYEPARDWLGTWQKAEVDAMSALEDCFRGETAASEPSAFWDLARVLPQGGAVYAGNSMPVRDLDGFFAAGERDALFLANRGASGIDGVVSSALGAAAAHEGRLVLVVGDLSFYHDMNGLLAAKRFGLRATIVLLNNDGGGIFSFLPQHDEAEHFEALFGTPHGLDFSHVAPLYGVGFRRVASREEYRAALQASFESDGVEVIEVRTDREENLRLHQRVWAAVAQAVSPLPQGKG